MCGIKQTVPEKVMNGCDRGCGGVRKILTKQEKVEKLKGYQKDLELELVAVRETLQELTKSK